MQNIFSLLDHVVLAVPDLQDGIEYVEKLTGCKPVIGGKHEQFGTQNALLKIGNLCYLEILAPDPSNPKEEALWMGLSEITEPEITRIALRSAEIEKEAKLLKAFDPSHGNCQVGRREKPDGTLLEWELSLPIANPKICCIPFLIDWKGSEHPSISLKQACQRTKIDLFSPNSTHQNAIFAELNIKSPARTGKEKIVLTLECPRGTIKLS